MQSYNYLLLFLLLLAGSACGDALVYQCVDDTGSTVFSDRACPEGDVEPRLQPAAPQVGTRDVPAGAYPDTRSSNRPSASKSKAKSTASASASEKRAREERCWKKRQQLEDVSARLRRGYKASQGVSLRRRRDRYEEYLREFCR